MTHNEYNCYGKRWRSDVKPWRDDRVTWCSCDGRCAWSLHSESVEDEEYRHSGREYCSASWECRHSRDAPQFPRIALRHQEFSFGGGGCNPGGLGNEVSQAEEVCRHCLQSLTAETIKIRNCGINWPPDSWPVCFTVEVRRHFAWVSEAYTSRRYCLFV